MIGRFTSNQFHFLLKLYGHRSQKYCLRWFASQAKQPIVCHALRHGQSQYNLKLAQCIKLYGSSNVHKTEGQNFFQYNKALLDASLTNRGQQQALDTSDYFSKHSAIKLVFVSPLERALETARLAFLQIQPQPHFVVLPEIAEIFSKICDISIGMLNKKQRYSMMDFGLLMGKELTWQSTMISKQHNEKVQKFLGPNLSQSESSILKYYLELLKEKFPRPLEQKSDFKERVQRAVEIMRQISEREGVHEVGMVSHRRILRELTKDDKKPQGEGFDNCEIRHIIL